jgi:glycosyltransferase involved in cell wall biosynthesis
MAATLDGHRAPLVSIALCTFNGALYLREQLQSLIVQQDVSIEIVIVDDASRDGTAAIAREYAAADGRIRFVANESNLGPTASFERAMSMCEGCFIAPCDQDDIWASDKLSRLLEVIGTCDAAYCDSDYVDAEGHATGQRISDATSMLSGRNPIAFLFANSVSGHALLLRRELFERARPFPSDCYHDWWLALCATGRNGIHYLDEPLVRFRRHDDAHSPMGRNDDAASRQSTASRRWIEQRYDLMRAYAKTGLRDNEIAGSLAEALQEALACGRNARLMWLVWRLRNMLPRWKGLAWIDAVKMQVRLAKKLRRARRTP